MCIIFIKSPDHHKTIMRPPGDHAGPEHVQAHLHTNYSICKYFMQNNCLKESSVSSYVMVFRYVHNKKESVCPGLCTTKGSGGGQGVRQTVCVCVCVLGLLGGTAAGACMSDSSITRGEGRTCLRFGTWIHQLHTLQTDPLSAQTPLLCGIPFCSLFSRLCSAPVCLRK